MTMIKGARRDLRAIDSSSLLEEFFSEYNNFQTELDWSEVSSHSYQYIERKYQKRTKSLREEINRRFSIKP